MVRVLGPLIAILLIASCTAGTAEFVHFQEAYAVQAIEAEKAIDRLGAAERTLKRRQLDQETGVRDFDPDEASYYLDLGDPPLAGAIRNSVRSVGLYNQALSGLATGETADALSARVSGASTALASAAQSFAAPGAGLMVAPATTAAIGNLLPLFRQAATAAHRAAFRRHLIAAYPDVRALLVEIRAGTPQMFDVMRRSYVQRGLLGGVDGIPAEDVARLEDDRRLLAGWVILLDRTLLAMDAARAALDGGQAGTVATLVSASSGVTTLAETIRALRSAD